MTDNNGRPHTHSPTVEQQYATIHQGAWVVVYGGVRAKICGETALPTAELTEAATRKVVVLHDKQVQDEALRRIALDEAKNAARVAAEVANAVVTRTRPNVDDILVPEGQIVTQQKIPWYRREMRRSRGS